MKLSDTDLRAFDFDLLLDAALSPHGMSSAECRVMRDISAATRGGRPPRPTPLPMLHLPQPVLDRRNLAGPGVRSLGASDLTAGGSLVGTMHLNPLTFSAARYAASVLGPAGATFVQLTVGDAEVPTIGKADVNWIGEGAEVSESTPGTTLANFVMRTVAAHVDVERRLVKAGIGSMLFPELARALGEAEEKAAFAGVGCALQPLGIIYTEGVAVGALGTNGALPSYDALLDLSGPVLNADAPRGSLGFITSATMRDTLARTNLRADGKEIFVWQPPQRPDADGMIGTFPAWATTACPSNLTKGSSAGVCSAIIFGAWSDLAIARWGGADVIVDPYSLAAQGIVRVFAYADLDVVVSRPDSFAMVLDALAL